MRNVDSRSRHLARPVRLLRVNAARLSRGAKIRGAIAISGCEFKVGGYSGDDDMTSSLPWNNFLYTFFDEFNIIISHLEFNFVHGDTNIFESQQNARTLPSISICPLNEFNTFKDI